MMLARRQMLGGMVGAAALWSAPAWAQDLPGQTVPPPPPTPPAPASEPPPAVPGAPPGGQGPATDITQAIAGFSINWQGGPQTPALVASLVAQIALVQALPIKPEIAAFFAAQPITVDLAPRSGTRATPTGITFGRVLEPDQNPVLLHELLHRYHLVVLPEGYDNPQIIAFYDAARKAGVYSPKDYMFKDCREFFAMCGSVTLYGKAARDPLTRASVAQHLPDVYAWIVTQFGLVV